MAEHIRSTHAVRLGSRQIIGAREDDMRKLVERRGAGYDSVRDLWLRTGPRARRRSSGSPTPTPSARSASTGARRCGRCAALDRVGDQDDLPLFAASRPERDSEPDARLPPMPLGAHVVEDYRRLSLSLKAHPVAFMRARLDARGIKRTEALARAKSGERVSVAGLVLVRQRPGTAKGVIFMTLEDETGVANIIVWPKVVRAAARHRHRRALRRRDRQVAERIRRHASHRRADGGFDADARPALRARTRHRDAARPADEVRRPQMTMAQKRQGNRFAQVQLFADARLPPPQAEERELQRAIPIGRRFH